MPIAKFATSVQDVRSAVEDFVDAPDFEDILDKAESDTHLRERIQSAARAFNNCLSEATSAFEDEATDDDEDDSDDDEEEG